MSTQPARGRIRPKSIAKRQRIMDATAKLIAERRSEDITLQDVGNEVGIYAASIYYYFESREELIREVHIASLERMRGMILDGIDTLPDDATALDRLKKALGVTIALNSSTDDYALAYTKVLNKTPSGEDDEDIRQSRKAIRDTWMGLLEDAQKAGQISAQADLHLAWSFMIGAMHWVSYWYRADGPSSTGEIADAYFDFLLSGIGGAPA